MKTPSIEALRGLLARWRCGPLLVLTAACLLVGEQYPLSDFPMYSSFGPTTYYLYLVDGSGRAVASIDTVGMSTPTLKKVFSSEMRKERERLGRSKKLSAEEKRVVGERFLAQLRSSRAARARGVVPEILRLCEVNIEQADGRFSKEMTVIAEAR